MSEGTFLVDSSPGQLPALLLLMEHACRLLVVRDHTHLHTVHLKSWLIKATHGFTKVYLLCRLILIVLLGHSVPHRGLA